MAAPQALAKPGRPFTGPTLPSIRSLQAAGFKAPLVVQLKRGTGSAVAEKTIRANGGRLLSTRLHIWLLQPDAARALLPDLIRRGVVSGVEPNQTAHAAHTFSFSDPLWQYEWWRGAVGAERVTAPGPGVPITVLDSGVDIGHPEFRGAPITLLNQQVLSDSSEDSHGTGVTSVAAAPANGVGIVGIYPGANVWAYDLRDLSTANVIAGIDAAIGRGRSVINMSFGSTEYSAMEEEEILIAFGTGSLLVAAAGNEFHEGNPVEYPASLNHVLTIAATDELNKPTEFSNSNDSVDLAAPGQDIVLATPFSFNPVGWEIADGTSFSAPITAAAAAWVWSVRRNLDHTQLFDLLRFSAQDIWDEDFDPDTGFGLLDIPTALSDKAPKPDPHEPNDDIYMVKAKGLFSKADAPLTRPGQGSSRLDARLDYTEDPEDVYRVYVPAHRSVTIRVVGDDDVNLDMWRPGTRTVYAKGAELRRYLIGSSARKGTAPETMTVRNSNRTAGVIYADVFLGKDAANASYTLHVTTSRK
jgi:subtilisin family serine protease